MHRHSCKEKETQRLRWGAEACLSIYGHALLRFLSAPEEVSSGAIGEREGRAKRSISAELNENHGQL
jgi:hypothetical protein